MIFFSLRSLTVPACFMVAAALCMAFGMPAQDVWAEGYCPFSVTGGYVHEDRNDAIEGAYADADSSCNELCPDFTGSGVSCTIRSQGGKNVFDCVARGKCDGDGLPALESRARGYCPFSVTGGAIDADRNSAIDQAYDDAESICNEACPDFTAGSVQGCTGMSQGGKTVYECIVNGTCDGEGLPLTTRRERGICPFEVSGGAIDSDCKAAASIASGDAAYLCEGGACPEFSFGSVDCRPVFHQGKPACECVAYGSCEGK